MALEALAEPGPRREPTAGLGVGCIVSICGLTKQARFNGHVGRIVVDLDPATGRWGVRLHGCVWPVRKSQQRRRHYDDSDADADDGGDDAPGRPARGLHEESPPIAVKAENLRPERRLMELERRPPGSRPQEDHPTVRGSLGAALLRSLLARAALPEHLVGQVVAYLQIPRLRRADDESTAGLPLGRHAATCELRCLGASSDRGDFPLSEALSPRCDTWWISGNGTMEHGRGGEWLEFGFVEAAGSRRVPRRASFLGVRIPPMPAGPLSVRKFYLLARTFDQDAEPSGEAGFEWLRIPQDPESYLETLDRKEVQEFALPVPVDTTTLRMVCVTNACGDALSILSPVAVESVGLYYVDWA